MDQPRWDRIAALFLEAVDRPTELRDAFLDEACTHDAGVRAEVAAMLAAHGGAGRLDIERRLVAGDGGRGPEGGALTLGTRVGPYRVEALVGEGGMGEVYRAERVDGGYRQTVALKVLRPGYVAADAVRRFRVERQVLARLVHPGIAAIYDGGALADGRPYLVLQFVDGVPITAYCDAHRLGVRDRLRLVCRVAEAVQFAHGHLVVHRDLKPSNILVDAGGAPRLLDFGIAKLLDAWPDDSLALTTRPDLRLLTPGHAAPEQLRGEPVGVATDVYGLGVLLFELLTGRRPFPPAGRTPAELERAVLHDPAPPPSAVAPRATARALAGDVDRIVLAALRKEPARRYATVAQLAEDLERYLAGRPVRAQRDTLGYRARKFVGRNRRPVAAGALAALALGGFAASAAVQARRTARERDRAEQERAAADDVIALLTGLFERANPAIVPGGDTVRVAALLDDGERRVDSLAAHPGRQARMWRVLGNMHQARGQYARAEPLLRRSWQAQRALHGADDVEAARTYHELAVLVSHLRGAPAARPMLDTSLATLRRLLGDAHADVAKALVDRAYAAATSDEQRRVLDEAVAVWRRQPDTDSVDVASLLNAQATERYERGAYGEARPLFEAALRILEQRLPPNHPQRLTATRNLASAFLALGDWDDAETLAREVVARAPRAGTGGPGPGDAEKLALIAAHRGRLDEAEAGLRASLATLRGMVAAGHPLVDNTLRNLGLIVVARGRVAEGLALLDSAVARARGRDGPRATGYGYMTGQRVMPLLRLGRVAEAAAAARESERVLRAALPDGHVYLADLARWHGEVALARGDAIGAEPHFRDALRRVAVQLPPRHPKASGASCLLGVALVRQGRSDEGRPGVDQACRRYARWGLADSLTLRWSRQARAALAGRRATAE
jgi:serine/threonine-protein kinase